MNQDILAAFESRRSIYALGKQPPIGDAEIRALIAHAVKHAPSAFNSQSARVLVLLRAEHDKLWAKTKEILRGVVPAERFAPTEAKLNGFAAAYGTVLFFEDQKTVLELQRDYPTYRDNFPLWSLQSSGMVQFMVWTLLEAAGCGANLQHYNPLIDDMVRAEWGIDADWRLHSQMPFGNAIEPAGEKEFLPIEERLRVVG